MGTDEMEVLFAFAMAPLDAHTHYIRASIMHKHNAKRIDRIIGSQRKEFDPYRASIICVTSEQVDTKEIADRCRVLDLEQIIIRG